MSRKNIVAIDDFITTYKLLEQRLREVHGAEYTVFDYEKTLDIDEQDKMSICRKLRNYIQHNSDSNEFVVVTASMQSFIEQHINRVSQGRTTAGKIAKKVKPLNLLSSVRDVCVWMKKWDTDCAPIVDDAGIFAGFVDIDMVRNVIARRTEGETIVVGKQLIVGGLWFNKLRDVQPPMRTESEVITNADVISFLDKGGTVFVINEDETKYIGIISKKAGNWK